MEQSVESIKANIATWINLPNNEVPDSEILDIMTYYISSTRIVGDVDLVGTYQEAYDLALVERDYDLGEDVSFYNDMYEYMKVARDYIVRKA